MRCFFVLSTFCAVLAALALGQTFTGSISGIVTDQTGAVLGEVSITVTAVDQNLNYKTLSNETGFYLIGQLQPGNYRIAAEKTGFRKYVVDSLPVSTQQKATMNIAMELGTVTENVEVTAQAQLVESTTSTLGAVVENKRILDLPLNGRNIYQLAALVPGVFYTRQLPTQVADTFTANRFVVNGGQESTSDILLDGVPATVAHNISTIPAVSAIPSVEGLQEFKIQTNAYSAEYGRSGGGLVTLVTKSGTNQLHGSAYELLRNSFFDANSFFANRAGRPLTSFKRNQFGASAGGPIYLPKVYNGRDRTFFFFDYEGQRIKSASLASMTLPTDAQRSGDFSQVLSSTGQPVVIYDPTTTRPDPANAGKFLRDPFPGNIIPAGRLNPVALNIQKYYPEPNAPGAAFTHTNNYVAQGAYPQPQDRVEFKIDHTISDATRIFGRYTFMDSVYSKPNFWGNLADPGCCDPMHQRLQNAALDYTHTLSNSTVLNVRYGLGRVSGNRYPWSKGFQVATLGLPASIDAISNQPVFPTVTIQNYQQFGPNGGDVYLMGDTSHFLMANLTNIKGRHSMKYGIDLRINWVNYGQLGTPSGGFNFYRAMTQGPDPRVPTAVGGDGYASFLLGVGGNGTTDLGGSITHQIRPANYNHYFAWYVQDDFKVSKRLTLNAGLRWDFDSGVTERYNYLTAFDPTVRNPLSDTTGMDLRGGFLFAGGSLGSRSIRSTDPHEINPRVGLVFQVDSKTVIRSGYGIFFGLPSYAANSGYTGTPFSSSTPYLGTLDGLTPNATLSNPFPAGYNTIRGSADGLLSQIGLGVAGGWPQALLPIYNQQWNFNIQRSLGNDIVLELAYAGNKGTHVAFSTQLDQLNPALLSMGDRLLDMVPNPFFGLINTGVLAQPTVQREYLLRPYPQFNGVSVTNAAWGNSNYHALQTRLEKRFSRGFSLLGSFTYSKTITDGLDGLWDDNGAQLIRNWYCRACNRSVSSYDQPLRFVMNTTYELPFGKGKAFGAGWNAVVDNILGNWQVNSILTISSGEPLRFTTAQNTTFSLGGGQTPDTTGKSADLGSARNIDRWFDTSQFLQPAPYTFGAVARSSSQLRYDHARNLDFSIFKEFRFKERARAELRGEAFNVMNHPLFGAPNTQLGNPLFGQVTSQENSPRQLQLGLKILF
jgi:Carboxypeptidase regulatory-like domain/TonB-dependent Receptor Plug Domain